MFTVTGIRIDGKFDHHMGFATEREARVHINKWANGLCVFTLRDPEGDVIVESSFPVMMVA